MVEIHKKRHAPPGLGADELRSAPQVLAVAVAPDVECQLIPLGDVMVAAFDLYHPRHRIALRVIPGIVRPQRLVVGARRPVPLLEALSGRPPARPLPDMPLAIRRAPIPGPRQQVTQRLLPRHHAPATRRPQRDAVIPRPDRMPPSQQSRAGRRALSLGRVVGQPEPLPSEGVDPPCPRPPERASAVTAQLPKSPGYRRGRTRCSVARPPQLPAYQPYRAADYQQIVLTPARDVACADHPDLARYGRPRRRLDCRPGGSGTRVPRSRVSHRL